LNDAMGPDADDYDDHSVLRAHVRHPDAPEVLRRKSLIVGSKGSGKSFFLKHQRLTNHKNAFLLKLPAELSAVSGDLGIGGRAEVIDPDRAASIKGKAAALFAASILKASADNANMRTFDSRIINCFLPDGEGRLGGEVNLDEARAIKSHLNRLSLEKWRHAPELDLIKDFSDSVRGADGELPVFFLDRAEDISAPALEVMMMLLDQSVPALTAIAARPAIQQLIPLAENVTMQPGDHYDLVHLGLDPYGNDWQQFVLAATQKYFELTTAKMRLAGDSGWTRALARDSIKMAIAYSQIAARHQGQGGFERLRTVMKLQRDTTESRARTYLGEYVDLRQMIAVVHQQIPEVLTGPQVAVDIIIQSAADQLSLLSEPGREARMLQAGIRAEAFFIRPGTAWHPYEVPSQVELNPILAWDGVNPRWIE